jgi:hypothetical protein
MDLKKLALACGSIGGSPITEMDVQSELRTKSYSRLVGRDGLLPPVEMARLKKHVRHAVAQKQVAEELSKPQPKPAEPKRSEPVAHGIHQTLASWKRSNRIGIAMACGVPGQSQEAQAAWAEYYRGPEWLR